MTIMNKVSRIFVFVGFVLGIGLARMKTRQLKKVSEQKVNAAYDISDRT